MNKKKLFLIIALLSIIFTAWIVVFIKRGAGVKEFKTAKLHYLEQHNMIQVQDNIANEVYAKNKVQAQEFMNMKLTSSAFENNQNIRSKYTCDGEDISPPFAISDVPPNTASMAIICDDPDAPVKTFVHWVLYNIPAKTKEIPENAFIENLLPKEAKQGINDFGKIGYGGPCPPSGTHRYFFKIYALDKTFDFEGIPTKQTLEKEMQGHILSETHLIGLYKRTR